MTLRINVVVKKCESGLDTCHTLKNTKIKVGFLVDPSLLSSVSSEHLSYHARHSVTFEAKLNHKQFYSTQMDIDLNT